MECLGCNLFCSAGARVGLYGEAEANQQRYPGPNLPRSVADAFPHLNQPPDAGHRGYDEAPLDLSTPRTPGRPWEVYGTDGAPLPPEAINNPGLMDARKIINEGGFKTRILCYNRMESPYIWSYTLANWGEVR